MRQIVTFKWSVYSHAVDGHTALHVEDMAAALSQHPCLENFSVLYGREEVQEMLTGQQVFQEALLAMPGLRQYNFCEVLDEAHIMRLLCQPSFSTLVIHEFSSDLDMTFDAVFKAIASEKSSVTCLEIKKNLNGLDKFVTNLVKSLECNKSLQAISFGLAPVRRFSQQEPSASVQTGTFLLNVPAGGFQVFGEDPSDNNDIYLVTVDPSGKHWRRIRALKVSRFNMDVVTVCLPKFCTS